MKAVAASVAAVEATLADRKTPDAAALALYDSAVQLQDKLQWLQQRIEAMISSGGALCKGELLQLAGELRGKLSEGQQALDAATAAGKKTDRLAGSLQALQAQLDRVASSQPMKRQETAADAEMRGLRRQLKQLQALEAGKGLLSSEQVKQLGGRRHLQERLSQMELEARGWFYDQVACAALGCSVVTIGVVMLCVGAGSCERQDVRAVCCGHRQPSLLLLPCLLWLHLHPSSCMIITWGSFVDGECVALVPAQ